MKKYKSIELKEDFSIKKIYSIHYFEYAKDFTYEGESHSFWELLCVDSGKIEVTAGDKVLTLQSNQTIFHKPDEFHALRADGLSSPNLTVISFACESAAMGFFEEKIVSLNQSERFYLGQILSEAQKAFRTPLNNPYTLCLERNTTPESGSEQMIQCMLQLFLLSLYRRYQNPFPSVKAQSSLLHPSLHKDRDELLQQIVRYMKRNIFEHLTVAQICKENSVGRSQLQKLFRDKLGCGVIDYFCRMKIETARKLIREKGYNYAQISDLLGYSSYQYFSLQFKKFTRMTPSEYASSVKNFSQLPNND